MVHAYWSFSHLFVSLSWLGTGEVGMERWGRSL